ncbi:NUDIX domain-containing protein [Georgenia sp. TF02-10]|uniref:NUDIX hydrolase n=1 Tax=Georgenia sp. TF02-10 TaxID=2917725 RepID=UPI001FA78983|nr:NUDIX domain-containing protein [Georgenia sp. TF02-10]UNX54237.1 NUDIX domain-containing protein [Georgenia sp. TF02-10]
MSFQVEVERIVAQVSDICPFDEIERRHRDDALSWLTSTDDVFRRVPPRTPPKHVVSYFLLHDPADGSVLLVDHRKSGLWLPTGGHVDPGEDPVQTVKREAREELGIDAVFAAEPVAPRFVTVTETTGPAEHRHTDVSLWFLLVGSRSQPLVPDMREFSAVRWWTPTEIRSADPARFEPHIHRFLTKVVQGEPSYAAE